MKIIQTLSALACLAGLASSPALCGASEHFRHVFAPQEGFVRGPEKDAREEICLNGKWDFMPVVIPEELRGIVKCANPKCITNNEPMATLFHVTNKERGIIQCAYCEKEQSLDHVELV